MNVKIQQLRDYVLHLNFARKFAQGAKKAIQKTYRGVEEEAFETKEMAQSFFKLLESKLDMSNRKEPPSKEEVKAALEQLMDIGRLSVFASVSILPGGAVSLIGLEILARKFGVKNFTFIPSAFRKKQKNPGILLFKKDMESK